MIWRTFPWLTITGSLSTGRGAGRAFETEIFLFSYGARCPCSETGIGCRWATPRRNLFGYSAFLPDTVGFGPPGWELEWEPQGAGTDGVLACGCCRWGWRKYPDRGFSPRGYFPLKIFHTRKLVFKKEVVDFGRYSSWKFVHPHLGRRVRKRRCLFEMEVLATRTHCIFAIVEISRYRTAVRFSD
jgi:hypothetical protein